VNRQAVKGVAVITDIHADLPALQAVLRRIDELGIEEVYCGGDLVGYGPHPNAPHGSPRKVNEYLFEDTPASLYERLAAAT
jgi:hypothetical protein